MSQWVVGSSYEILQTEPLPIPDDQEPTSLLKNFVVRRSASQSVRIVRESTMSFTTRSVVPHFFNSLLRQPLRKVGERMPLKFINESTVVRELETIALSSNLAGVATRRNTTCVWLSPCCSELREFLVKS